MVVVSLAVAVAVTIAVAVKGARNQLSNLSAVTSISPALLKLTSSLTRLEFFIINDLFSCFALFRALMLSALQIQLMLKFKDQFFNYKSSLFYKQLSKSNIGTLEDISFFCN